MKYKKRKDNKHYIKNIVLINNKDKMDKEYNKLKILKQEFLYN